MENIEAIKTILDKHSYRVAIETTPDGCIATFPKHIEEPEQDSIRIQYAFGDNQIRIIVYDEDGQAVIDVFQPCPNYAQKLLILSDIVVRSLRMNFTVALAKFILDGEEISEEDFYDKWINVLCSEDDNALSRKLKPLIITCIFSGFNPMAEAYAEHNGILDGYKAIKDFMVPTSNEESDEEKNTVDGRGDVS